MDKINENRLNNLRTNSSQLTSALSMLHESGIIDILRNQGRIQLVSPVLSNYVEVTAANGNHSAGYNNCLDDLINFKERFIDRPVKTSIPDMDFGGLSRAVKLGQITEEEAYAIRTSQTHPSK